MNFLAAAAFLCVASLTAGEPCICTLEFDPVCGTDGKTYGNECGMHCAGTTLSHTGECTEADQHLVHLCPCVKIHDPQCGQDGKTYENTCLMNCAGVEKAYAGSCVTTQPQAVTEQTACICTFMFLPVCGTDGKTYSNECNLNCSGVAKFHDGACP